jgi:hypothetical protein
VSLATFPVTIAVSAVSKIAAYMFKITSNNDTEKDELKYINDNAHSTDNEVILRSINISHQIALHARLTNRNAPDSKWNIKFIDNISLSAGATPAA